MNIHFKETPLLKQTHGAVKQLKYAELQWAERLLLTPAQQIVAERRLVKARKAFDRYQRNTPNL